LKKKKIKSQSAITILFLLAAFFTGNKAISQSLWLEEGTGNSISIEVSRPFIPKTFMFDVTNPAFTTLSGSIFISGRYNIGKGFTLVGDLPLSGGNFDDSTYNGLEEYKIGNPYLGAEYRLPKSPIMFEAGIRIPITPENKTTATLAGIYSDFDRGEAFAPKIVPFFTAVNYETISESNLLLRLRAGTNLWFNSKEYGLEPDPHFSIDYSLQGGYLHKHVHVIAGLSARYFLDSNPQNPDKATELQYGLSLSFPFRNFRPGLVVKIPGSSLTGDLINYVIGFNLTYSFDKFK